MSFDVGEGLTVTHPFGRCARISTWPYLWSPVLSVYYTLPVVPGNDVHKEQCTHDTGNNATGCIG